jgi:hypothetical protein
MLSTYIHSSAIVGARYDPDTHRMWITFKDGGTYQFCRVPRSVYDGLVLASSAGTFYHAQIRDRYAC